MLTVQLVFVVALILSSTSARPNDHRENEVPESGIVYGVIFNFTSPGDMHSIVPVGSEIVTSSDDISTSNGEKLVRKKRFLFDIVGYALQSLRSDNWRECGRTPWGTTIYTNGIATACVGACPENVYCGYGYNGYGYSGYGGNQVNTVYIG